MDILINLPIGLVGCILAFFFMPNIRETPPPSTGKAYLCFSSGIVLLSIAIQRLGEAGATFSAFLLLAIPVLFACMPTSGTANATHMPCSVGRYSGISSFRIGILVI